MNELNGEAGGGKLLERSVVGLDVGVKRVVMNAVMLPLGDRAVASENISGLDPPSKSSPVVVVCSDETEGDPFYPLSLVTQERLGMRNWWKTS